MSLTLFLAACMALDAQCHARVVDAVCRQSKHYSMYTIGQLAHPHALRETLGHHNGSGLVVTLGVENDSNNTIFDRLDVSSKTSHKRCRLANAVQDVVDNDRLAWNPLFGNGLCIAITTFVNVNLLAFFNKLPVLGQRFHGCGLGHLVVARSAKNGDTHFV